MTCTMTARGIAAACTLTIATLTASLLAETASPRVVSDFTLRSHRGREWALADVADKKVTVIAFLGTECPLVKLYGPRLADLQQEFGDQGVAVVGINANTQDSATEITAYAERYGINFPLLKDTGNRVADAIGATRTPEVFVLDANHVVRYHGRIDDQYGVGKARDEPDRKDLRLAIEQLLANEPVEVAETAVVGCLIGRVKETPPTGDITYSSHIASIFNQHCLECHRSGEIAPFPLASYDDVVGWEDTIVEVIQDRRMPPWFADPEHGEFANDCRLSDEDQQLIFQWVENGMPEGDSSQLPPPPEFEKGWRIPKPDQVFAMRDKPFTVPAQGIVDYQHFMVDPKWSEDKYVYAAEARPDNTSVVHHILVYIIPPGDDPNPKDRQALVGYAPGSTPVLLQDGIAMRVPAGSQLLFELHYTPNGHEQTDLSYAGVCFMDKQDVTKICRGRLAINTDFEIPPHEGHHVVTAKYRFRSDEELLSMTPHMHLRGKAFRYEAHYPNGQHEILLDVPHYDFNWQLKYTLAKPKRMPKGTTMVCTAVFDNSPENIVNPNPEKSVRWGDQSWQEMMIGFFDTLPADSEPTAAKAAPASMTAAMAVVSKRRQTEDSLSNVVVERFESVTTLAMEVPLN